MKNRILIITALSIMQSIMPMEKPTDICMHFAEAVKSGTLIELLVHISEPEDIRNAHTLLLCMNRMKTHATENGWQVVCYNPQSNENITEPDALLNQARKIITAQLISKLTKQQMLLIKKLLDKESWERAQQILANSCRSGRGGHGPLTITLLDLDDPIVYQTVYEKVKANIRLL
jgi:hypothetical protein